MQQSLKHSINTKEKTTAVLSATEVGLGSLLHAFHIPLSGQILSLNQILILSNYCKTSKQIAKSDPATISLMCALFKSLSPAGKKLTPMAAISTQGALYSLGLFFFGNNILGNALGAVLSSLWAFVQPILIYTLLFGSEFLPSVLKTAQKLTDWMGVSSYSVIQIMLAGVSLKVILAILISTFSTHSVLQRIKHLNEQRAAKNPVNLTKPHHSDFKSAIKEALKPLFIISWIFSIGLFFFEKNLTVSIFIWHSIRPVAVAVLLFYLFKKIPFYQFKMSRVK